MIPSSLLNAEPNMLVWQETVNPVANEQEETMEKRNHYTMRRLTMLPLPLVMSLLVEKARLTESARTTRIPNLSME